MLLSSSAYDEPLRFRLSTGLNLLIQQWAPLARWKRRRTALNVMVVLTASASLPGIG
jgi:hypothetical protein